MSSPWRQAIGCDGTPLTFLPCHLCPLPPCRLAQEMKRVAQELSQLPKELNVEFLVLDAMSEGADAKTAQALAAAAAKRLRKEIPRTASRAA